MDVHRGFLRQCEQERLHLSGAIQGFGALVVCDAGGVVSHVSANLGGLFGDDPVGLPGGPLPERLAAVVEELGAEAGSRLCCENAVEGPAGELDLVASRAEDGGMVIELMPALDSPAAPAGREPHPEIRDDGELERRRDALVERVASVTGFDRVLYYRFLEEGDGEVVAETCRPGVAGSYLGLRFPASDVPRVARALYLRNPWRAIPDAAAEPVPLVGRDAEPPDLSYSDLRSVSPVHRVYMANMGVAASLSLPLPIGGDLTALVACHHHSPRRLPVGLLRHVAGLVADFNLARKELRSRQRLHLLDGLGRKLGELGQLISRHGDIEAAWPDVAPWLMTELEADGAVLVMDGRVHRHGLTPESDVLAALERHLADRHDELVLATDHLARLGADMPLSQVAGVLALRLGNGGALGGVRLYLSRGEVVQEVAWGGNPDKPVEHHDGRLGIAPRRSFEKWVEKRLGYSRPWPREARLKLLKLRDFLLKTTNHHGNSP